LKTETGDILYMVQIC